MKKGLDIKKLEELFGMEQELDIPMKDRFHNTLSAEQISELTDTKGSYPADKIEQLKYLDMKPKTFWIENGGKYETHWKGVNDENDPDSVIFKSDDLWNFMQEFSDQQNLEMKKQNTELAKLLKKSVKIIKQWEIDESK